MNRKTGRESLLITLFIVLFWTGSAQAERLLDMVDVQGVRTNQLLGYGLVVGLDGTGDKTKKGHFTSQSLVNMLREFGITLNASDPALKNVAAVSVSAELPPFVRPGQQIDVIVSSIGDASSLKGGTLLMTPLKGIDGEIYAIAQGNMVVGGASAAGAGGSKVTVNTVTVGRVPNGATVERSVPSSFNRGDEIVLTLKKPSFTNARSIVRRVNEHLGPEVAKAWDGASVIVKAPRDQGQRVTFMSVLEGLEVTPAQPPARVIFNSRTGTVVMGQNVRVLPAAVSHGSLVVTIQETNSVSQPNPLASGTSVGVTNSNVAIEEQTGSLFYVPESVSLQDIVTAINGVGASPSDLMSILQALKEAGALRAELVVI
ncbi:flagellar basal body P-ring protein FlgI [Parendozoicomonas haliclonae]|uniref:Flagellar P-ring protein n=1 Tax=Parendozoicomonas haliclonae TaxID=1960125 RepID=A0A1X7AGD3_9GAMM|nr:flagellar basal body P-ring protein FlgI [Parendozoicomonas haliclonae]SMA39761.1 Flagellar P-ring protein precursor [Parendozoicomonas haliclonae]